MIILCLRHFSFCGLRAVPELVQGYFLARLRADPGCRSASGCTRIGCRAVPYQDALGCSRSRYGAAPCRGSFLSLQVHVVRGRSRTSLLNRNLGLSCYPQGYCSNA